VLVDALTGTRRSEPALRQAIRDGARMAISVVVLFEWLRGPRSEAELLTQEEILPGADAVPLTSTEAVIAAQFYRRAPRARSREADFAIAATAASHEAAIWTLNTPDFRDIPGIRLYSPSA